MKVLLLLFMGFILFSTEIFAACDYPSDLDSRGYRCGGRAASVIPGGRLGGDGRYTDSYGKNRVYGKNNDIYDKPSYGSRSLIYKELGARGAKSGARSW
jgi:hypothetical protein